MLGQELRNPLAPIRAAADLLEMATTDAIADSLTSRSVQAVTYERYCSSLPPLWLVPTNQLA